MARKTNG